MVTKVSVIVPVWNGLIDLPACLDAVLMQSYPDFEVIVMDDGSTDGSADYVTQHYPSVRVSQNEHNFGYSITCNKGLDLAEGDVLVLLNQDTEAHPGWLDALVEAIKSDRKVGIVGGKCLYPGGDIQHAGGYLDARGAGYHYGYGEKDEGQYERRREVEFVTGANLAISRLALDAIGKLDEGYAPAYFEDVDWCLRARDAGFRVLYEPRAVITHKEASLLAGEDRESMGLFHRNRLRLVLTHWSLSRLVGEFCKEESQWLRDLKPGGERLVSAMHRAYLFYLLNLGDVMTLRSERFNPLLNEVDALVHVLLDLRAVAPLGLAKVSQNAGSSVKQPKFVERDETMSWLHNRWTIEARPFRSDVPVLGPLIVKLRQLWNRISTEWYVRPMIQQQTEFNAHLVEMIAALHRDLTLAFENQSRLSEVLEVYMSEDGREIASLADIVRRLEREIQRIDS